MSFNINLATAKAIQVDNARFPWWLGSDGIELDGRESDFDNKFLY